MLLKRPGSRCSFEPEFGRFVVRNADRVVIGSGTYSHDAWADALRRINGE